MPYDTDFLSSPHIRAHTHTHIGYCARCEKAVVGIENGLLALDNIYHTECFNCTRCCKSKNSST